MNLYVLIASFFVAQPPSELVIRETAPSKIEVVARLSAAQQKSLPIGKLTTDEGESLLRLCLVDPETKKTGPAMFGAYEREEASLIFRPRFGVEPGRNYRATFGPLDGPVVTKDHRPALRNGGATTVITKIYPTADVLPANQLKFTIYFSQPMRGGKDIFDQIEILDASGNAISDAWLTDELWDETGQILIIYIHPGRIKWGVVLREVFGPVLHENREYTFVVRGSMLDANGQKLGKDVMKKFRTTAEDRVRIDLSEWTVKAPSAGSSEAVVVQFPKSLNHKSLETALSVVDAEGNAVAGMKAIGKEEKSWSFTPTRPWTGQEYRLTIDPRLEDVAGNTPTRPFDLDLRAPPLPAQRLEMAFRPRS